MGGSSLSMLILVDTDVSRAPEFLNTQVISSEKQWQSRLPRSGLPSGEGEFVIRSVRKFVFLLVTVLSAAGLVAQAQSVMTHHVRDAVRNGQAQATGRLPSNQVLQLDLVLPLRDQAGLDAFLKELYNPSSPSYRQFLTPPEFTARFGPTQENYDAVVRFAKTYGFEVVGGSRDGMDVQVKGTVAAIETAFHVNMRTYKHPTENRDFYGPDSEPALDLPFNLWHVSGLDNYSIPHPHAGQQE